MNSKFKNYTKDDMLKKSQQNTCFMAIDIGDKSCKSFDSFSSHDSFINFKNSLKIKEQNFYEIIREESVEYYDCECDDINELFILYNTTYDFLVEKRFIKNLVQARKDFLSNNDEWNITDKDLIHIYILSSTKDKKFSLHITIRSNYYFPDLITRIEYFKSFFQFIKDYDIFKFIDSKVYNKDRLFRIIGSTKKGKDRPFIRSNYNKESREGYEIMFFNSYIHNKCVHEISNKYVRIILEEPKHEEEKNIDKDDIIEIVMNHPDVKDIFDFPDNNCCLKRLQPGFCSNCQRIHHNDNSSYNIKNNKLYLNCRRATHGICIKDFNIDDKILDVILNHRIVKNNFEYENGLLKRIKPSFCDICDTTHYFENYSFNLFGSKIFLNCSKNPKGVCIHDFTPTTPFKERLNIKGKQVDCNDEFVQDFSDERVIIIKSCMGSGKSTSRDRFIKRLDKNLTICILTPRITFANSVYNELKDEGFFLYSNNNIENSKRVIIQVESVYRIKKIPDILIMDECEALLYQFSSSITHGENFVPNINMLDIMFRSVKKIVLMDAMMSNKTFDFVNKYTTVYSFYNYTKKPVERTCERLTPIKEGNKLNISPFVEKLLEELKKGKNIFLVCSSFNKLNETILPTLIGVNRSHVRSTGFLV